MALSPHAAYLAYSQLDPTTGQATYVVCDVARQANVVRAAMPAGSHAASLRWSPTSDALAYMAREGAWPGAAISDSIGLYVLDVTTGEAREVPYTPSPEAHIAGWTGNAEGIMLQGLDTETMTWRVDRVDVVSGETESLAVSADALIRPLPAIAGGPCCEKRRFCVSCGRAASLHRSSLGGTPSQCNGPRQRRCG